MAWAGRLPLRKFGILLSFRRRAGCGPETAGAAENQSHRGDAEAGREEEPAADTSFDTTEFGENISFDFGSNDEPEEMEAAFAEDESGFAGNASAETEAVEGFRAPGGPASIPEVLKFLLEPQGGSVSHTFNIIDSKVVCDDGPPSVGAEFYFDHFRYVVIKVLFLAA